MDMRGHNSRAMPGNWLAINRDLERHPVVGFGQPVKPADPKRGSYSRGEAWQSLLFQAQYAPGEVENKGRTILLDRGQLMGGLQHLAEKWNWTIETVRWFVKKLEQASMALTAEPVFKENRSSLSRPIHPKRDTSLRHNTVRILTICNYSIYQTAMELDNMLHTKPNPKPTPSEPQESNKETNKQTTTLSAGTPFVKTRESLNRLESQLLDACNGAAADPAAAPKILSMAEPLRWMEQGCDLELDIIPTIRSRAHKMPPRSVKSWEYFTQAIADAKASRMAPMPAGAVRQQAPARDWQKERETARASDYISRIVVPATRPRPADEVV
jgi:hypothetical protein